MKSTGSLAFIIIFFTISLIPFTAMSFRRNLSSNENRVLQGMPHVMADGMLNKKYFSELSDYFSDNFAYRVDLVQLNELLYTGILKHSTNEKVIYGKDGWLYFSETLNDYTGKTNMQDSDIERLAVVLSLKDEYLDSLEIKYIFAAAPNKNTIYPEYMPSRFVRTTSPTVMERLSQSLVKRGVCCSDLTQAIIDAKRDGSILYHKSDTHWNDMGARIACGRLMRDIKSYLPVITFDDYSNLKMVETKYAGDLSKMLFPLKSQYAEGYTSLEIKKLYKTNKSFRSVEDASIVTTSGVNKYRIMMFRDSFGNAIIPFISNNFGYVYYSKEYPVNFNDIESHAPDIVVQEIAERNIPKLIEKAPVMPAIKRDICFSSSKRVDGEIFTASNGRLVHIYGYLDYYDKRPYRCYVTGAAGKTFEAFPIVEAEKMADKFEDRQNVSGFSLYLKKADFITGNLSVTVDYGDEAILHTYMVQEE